MGAVKELLRLMLLGCFLPAVILSPIKGKNDSFASQSSRFLSIKSVSSSQQQATNIGIQNDPSSPVASFNSDQSHLASDSFVGQDVHRPQTGNFNTDSHDFGPKGIDQSADFANQHARQDHQQTFQPTETPVLQVQSSAETHTEPPVTSDFGARIQKSNQDSQSSRCSAKGGCSTFTFTSEQKVPSDSKEIASIGNRFEVINEPSTVTPYDDDRQKFATTQQPQKTDSLSFDHHSTVPDSQDLSHQGQSQVQQFEGSQYEIPNEFFPGHIQDDGDHVGDIAHPNFDTQRQISTQTQPTNVHQFGDNFATQEETFHGHDEQRNTLSTSYQGGQTYENTAPNFDVQNNFQSVKQFEDHQDIHKGSTAYSQSHKFGQELVTGLIDASEGQRNYQDDGRYYHYENPIEGLRYNVPGNPGEDYPIFYQVPETSFSCQQQLFSAGIYGDMESSCQVFHVCKQNGGHDSFLCPNGTVFNQQYFICDWWYNYKCSDTPVFYNLNADLYWDWDSFTPTQVLNVPSGDNGEVLPNIQGGTSGSSNRISNSGANIASQGVSLDHNQAIKTTISIDNSAIANKNRNGFEQRLDNQVFTDEKSLPPNAVDLFKATEQGNQQQQVYQSQSTSDFRDASDRRHSGNTSPDVFADVRKSSTFTPISNQQNENDFHLASSDIGANRKPETDRGTRYPDQNGYGQQDNVFQTQFVNTPLARDIQSSAGPDALQVTQAKPITQDQVSLSFRDVNQNPFVDTTSQDQIDYKQGDKNTVPFDNNQQSGSPNTAVNNTQNRDRSQEVQQQGIFNSFDQNVFDSSKVNEGQSEDYDYRDSLIGNRQIASGNIDNQNIQQPANYVTNQVQQEVQHDISDSFGRNMLDISRFNENRNTNSDYNRDVPFVNSQTNTESHNFNQHVSGTFSDSRSSLPNNENDQIRVVQNQNIFTHQQTDTPFTSIGKNDFDSRVSNNKQTNIQDNREIRQNLHKTQEVSSGNRNQVDRNNNKAVQQVYISNSFDGNRASDFVGISTPDQGDSQNTQVNNENMHGSFINSQDNTQGTTGADTFRNNQKTDDQDVQQEDISTSFKGQQLENDRNHFSQVGFVTERDQIANNNQQNTFQQEHIFNSFEDNMPSNFGSSSSSLPGETQNTRINLDNNSANKNNPFTTVKDRKVTEGVNVHQNSESDRNTDIHNVNIHQSVQQEPISTSFGEQQLSNDRNQFSQEGFVGVQDQTRNNNQQNSFQQEQVLNSFDDKNLNKFEGVPNSFQGETQNTRINNDNNIGNIHNLFINVRDHTDENRPQTFGNDQISDAPNIPAHHDVQQEQILTLFDSRQQENDRNRFSQEGLINAQDQTINNNQQNDFRSGSNNDGPIIQQGQYLDHGRPQSFSSGNQQPINDQNAFVQNENRGWQQVQQQRQSVSFGNNGPGNRDPNQNTNIGSEMRLNDFQPNNIHTTSRGGIQDKNPQHQPMSFRPYGQNSQNNAYNANENPTDIFQGQAFVPMHFNNNGPSNHNFFVTNGHQTRNGQEPQQINPNQFSDQRSTLNVQEQPRQYIQQNVESFHPNDHNQFSNQRPVQGEQPKQYVHQNVESSNRDQSNDGLLLLNRNPENIDDQSTLVPIPNLGIVSGADNYRNTKNIDYTGAQNSEIDPRGSPTLFINGDAMPTYNHPESQGAAISYNGWRPIIKY